MSLGTMDHKCKSCGAVLKFNPHGQNWVCEYCKSEFTKEEVDAYEAERGVEALTKETEAVKLETNWDGADMYSCPNCGAEIIADENTSATFCVYCKNTAILKNKLVGEFNPTKLIPFYKTREDAIAAFKNMSKNKKFVPNDFLVDKNIEEMRGIYIPFWLYDYDFKSDIVADAKKVTTWRSGDTRYTKTDTYSCTRGALMEFNKIPVDGSSHFDNAIMNSIEPFDYNGLIDFSHSYLSGFLAEKYDVDATTADLDAQNRARATATEVLKDDIKGYNSVVVTNSNHNITKALNEYVLLPVWILNIKYKDKVHTFAMNGQTGKMVGDIPVDKNKAVRYCVMLFFICMIVITLAVFIFGGYSI